MSLSIADRISIKFHDITGGNVSSGRALRLAEGLKGVQNVPDKIAKVLSKKIDKHPELKKSFPREVNITLATRGYDKAINIYKNEMTRMQTSIKSLKEKINNFDKSTNALSETILNDNKSVDFRLAVRSLLGDLGTSFNEKNILKNEISDLSGKNYAFNNRIKSSQQTLDYLTKQFGRNACLAPAYIEAQKEISINEEKISNNNSSISMLKTKLTEHKNVVAHAAIAVAETHKELVTGTTARHISAFKKDLSELQSAPNIIKNLSHNITNLKEMHNDATTTRDNLEFLKTLEIANEVIKNTNLTLIDLNRNLQNIKTATSRIMNSEFEHASSINQAIVQQSKDQKPEAKAEETLNLPDVPNHRINKQKPEKSQPLTS